MPWVDKEVAMQMIKRRPRYKVKLKPKGLDKFFTLNRKEILSFIEWHNSVKYKIDGMKNEERTVYIYDYEEEVK